MGKRLQALSYALGLTDIPRSRSRAYAAASMGRLTGDWLATATSIDSDIRSGMVQVRSRARDLSQNNEFARAYLRAVKKNVVGSEGFALQVKAMNFVTGPDGKTKAVPDRLANSILEGAFYDWARPEYATVTGKVSFRKAQEIIVETAARDGEQFVRLVRGKNINKYGFSLQLIEPDWIDERYSEQLKNGNVVRMGVELDGWRRPVAYYVTKRNETLDLYGTIAVAGGPRVRVPAADMIHVFDPERADQTRGISWMAPAMLGMHNLKGYVEAAVINARVGASKMGFFRDPTSGAEYTGDAVDGEGNRITNVEPGQFEDIGTKEFTPYDPKYPDQQFDPFVKSILRGVSSGLGVSFSSLSNDLTEVNFSSIRAGLIEERETWKTLQSWFIETVLSRVYSEWLDMALVMGAVNLPYVKYDKFNSPKWTGRRWAWVDPLKDVEAARAAVAAGFKSATQIINEAGGDIEDVYQEIKAEQELAQEYGVTTDYGGKANDAEKENPPGEGDEDDTARPSNGKDRRKDGRSLLLV